MRKDVFGTKVDFIFFENCIWMLRIIIAPIYDLRLTNYDCKYKTTYLRFTMNDYRIEIQIFDFNNQVGW